MKKTIFYFIFLFLVGQQSFSQVTQLRIGSDYPSTPPTSYTFASGDVIYQNSSGTAFVNNRNASNICSGAVYRVQLSTVILELKSSATNSITVHGQSSGSSLRSLTSVETSSSLNGTYTLLTGVNSTSTINSSSTCGTLSITNISIPNSTFIRITFNGNVNLSGFDITQFHPIVQPTVQASSLNFSNLTQSTATVNWTNGNGSNRAVFVKAGTQGTIVNPVDGVGYTANSNWNSGSPSGTQLGTSGYYCVYNGSGSSVSLSNLSPFTHYWVYIFEYNGTGSGADYLVTTALHNPNHFATPAIPISVSINGNFNIGVTLEGEYDYSEFPGAEEGTSLYQWYLADTALGGNATAISGATTLSYTIPLSDEGKYLRFGVIPVDSNALQGSASFSGWGLVNYRPVASQVTVSGVLVVTNALTASYVYSDTDSDAEASSLYQWYHADDALGTNSVAINGATAVTYTLENETVSKYIRFGVLPNASSGSTPGDEVFSSWEGPVLSATAPLAFAAGSLSESSLTTDVVTLTLVNDSFVGTTLATSDFILNNAPAGVSVATVLWVSATEASVSFAYDGQDFDTDVADFSLTIAGTVLTSGTSLTTNDLPLFSVLETLDVSGVLSFDATCVGATAAEGSFTISGASLKAGAVTVAALTGYTYSTTIDGSYTTSLSLSTTGGDLAPTQIYVRFTPTAVTNFAGSIFVSSPGAPAVTQEVSGTGIATPSTISSPSSTSVTSTGATLGGTITSLGCSAVVERGIYYSTTNGFANGTGTKVSEQGDSFTTGAFTVTTSGLASGTTYYYTAFLRGADGVTVYTVPGSFTTLPIASPAATAATAIGSTGFSAHWQAAPGATSYALDVSVLPNFGLSSVTPNQVLVANGFSLTQAGWNFTNVTVSSSTFQMISSGSQITTAAFTTVSYTPVALNFEIRTFGGTTSSDASNHLYVYISTDNGLNWTLLATRIALTSSLTSVVPISLNGYVGSQVRLRFETPFATGSRGVGIKNIAVTGDLQVFTPSFVPNYENLAVATLQQPVTGLSPETTYYYRVRALDATSVSSNSSTISVTTLPFPIWYADADADGFGDVSSSLAAEFQPEGYVANSADCDDTRSSVYPGAPELCDGLDTDCNGFVDDGLLFLTYYLDEDGDGYGVTGTGVSLCADPGEGFATLAGDCNDQNAAVHPGAVEVPFDGIDNDCDGVLNNGFAPVVSVIQANKCGTVNNGLNNTLNTTEVLIPGAFVGYLFKVTNTSTGMVSIVPRAVPNFKLTMADNYQYDTWYTIEVAVIINGEEQPYGPSCSIKTTTVNTSKVVTSQCGATLNAINSSINAVNVGSANRYRFRIASAAAPTVYYYTERMQPKFELTDVNGFVPAFETQYLVSVQVRVKLGGIEAWSQFGDVCSIFTPKAPETSIVESQCDWVATSDSEVIYTLANSSASLYKFRLQLYGYGDNDDDEDEDEPLLVYEQVVSTTSPFFTLSLFTGLEAATTYTINVTMVIFGVEVPYGKDCSITTPGGARFATGTSMEVGSDFSVVGFPNPFSDSFVLEVQSLSRAAVVCRVYDMMGRLLERKTVAVDQFSGTSFGANYPAGVYTVEVSQGEVMEMVRVVKR